MENSKDIRLNLEQIIKDQEEIFPSPVNVN